FRQDRRDSRLRNADLSRKAALAQAVRRHERSQHFGFRGIGNRVSLVLVDLNEIGESTEVLLAPRIAWISQQAIEHRLRRIEFPLATYAAKRKLANQVQVGIGDDSRVRLQHTALHYLAFLPRFAFGGGR